MAMPASGITLYVASGILRDDDKEVLLTPQESRVLEILALHSGFFVSLGRMIMGVYADNEPEESTSSIRVVMFHLRKKIAPMGCRIESKWGTGWRVHPKIKVVQQ